MTELKADCSRCAALCCVAPAFSRSADFAADKPAGTPCHNLRADFGCRVHERLRDVGYAGCAVYDCFGAGQHVTQVTYAGQTWHDDPGVATQMFAVFAVVRSLHELLWYVTEALRLPAAEPLRDRLVAARTATEDRALLPADDLLGLDVEGHRATVNALLQEVSVLARARHPAGTDHRGADLVGADLRRTDLRGANLRGAALVGADLTGSDLTSADLTGADLRAARLGGADLGQALFVTQAQLDAAQGDDTTRIPGPRTRPSHWGRG